MCCACRCILRTVLFHINGCYLVIGIIAAIFFGLFKWGVAIFLNALTSLIKSSMPNASVNPSDLVPLLQPAFDNVAWVLLCVAIIFLALGVFGNFATCCPKLCSCLGWAYIGILTLVLIAEIIFIIVWFATANARVQAIKSGLKQHIHDSFRDFWQLSNNFNAEALAFNFANVHFNCCGISDSDKNPQWDYWGAVNWNRTYQIPGKNYTNQTLIPLTCCKVNASYWPYDLNCPVTPTTSNANLDISCYDTVYNNYVNPYVWIQWIVYVFLGVIIIAPGVLMFFLMRLADLP